MSRSHPNDRFDARFAVGFTRWLLRQRHGKGALAEIAKKVRSDATWPYRARRLQAFADHVSGQPDDERRLRDAWALYCVRNAPAARRNGPLSAGDAVEIEVDWVRLEGEWRASQPLTILSEASERDASTAPPAGVDLGRLHRLAHRNDPGAARQLLTIARRRGDLPCMRIVRGIAWANQDWSLLCELLASGGDAIVADTFLLARKSGNTYLLDRTIELGSQEFTRRIYEEARTLEQPDSLHIALAAVKALLPDDWQRWLPDDLLHAAIVSAPTHKSVHELPPLPECLRCLEPDGRCTCPPATADDRQDAGDNPAQ